MLRRTSWRTAIKPNQSRESACRCVILGHLLNFDLRLRGQTNCCCSLFTQRELEGPRHHGRLSLIGRWTIEFRFFRFGSLVMSLFIVLFWCCRFCQAQDGRTHRLVGRLFYNVPCPHFLRCCTRKGTTCFAPIFSDLRYSYVHIRTHRLYMCRELLVCLSVHGNTSTVITPHAATVHGRLCTRMQLVSVSQQVSHLTSATQCKNDTKKSERVQAESGQSEISIRTNKKTSAYRTVIPNANGAREGREGSETIGP